MAGGSIQVVAAGTYYIPHSPHAGENVWPMRGLVWHAKNKKVTAAQSIAHPILAMPSQILSTPAHAYEYGADVLAALWRKYGPKPTGRPMLLVPIPAHTTTRLSPTTERWPARALALALERRGLGKTWTGLFNQVPFPTSDHEGVRHSVDELRASWAGSERPPYGSEVVLIDDLLTWGKHLAAAHSMLAPEVPGWAMTIATTDSTTMDAYVPRVRTVSYDAAYQVNVTG